MLDPLARFLRYMPFGFSRPFLSSALEPFPSLHFLTPSRKIPIFDWHASGVGLYLSLIFFISSCAYPPTIPAVLGDAHLSSFVVSSGSQSVCFQV